MHLQEIAVTPALNKPSEAPAVSNAIVWLSLPLLMFTDVRFPPGENTEEQ